MMTYILCEGPSDKQILNSLLPTELLDTVVLVAAEGIDDAVSLARSLSVQRQAPVLVLADADATSPRQIAERQNNLDSIVGGVAVAPFKVVLAVPEIESIFFQDVDLLSQLTGQTFSPEVLTKAIYEPSQVLKQLMPEAELKQDYSDLLEQLSESDRASLRHSPPIQEVIQFLQSVNKTANAA